MKTSVLIFFLLISSVSMAQLTTDRPDQTESSSTVGKFNLQLETGFSYEISKYGSLDFDEFVAPTTLIRFGIIETLELRFVAQYSSSEFDSKSTSGLNDIELGAKIELLNNPEKNIEMAFLTHIILPTAKKELSNGDYVIVTKLAISHEISNRLAFGYNFGFDYIPNEDVIITYSAALGYSLTDKLGAYIEPYGGIIDMNDIELNGDFGFTYLINDHFQLDLSSGVGLSHNMKYIATGFSWLID